MMTSTMNHDIFKLYVYDLYTHINRKLWLLQHDSSNTERLIEVNGRIYGNFSLFENIKAASCFNDYEVIRLSPEEGSKFTSSLDTDKNKFPCFARVKYRGHQFPLFLDDYGMDEFLELKIGDRVVQVSLMDDGYYEVDRLLDLERALTANTPAQCRALLEEIEKDPFYE